jgi:hypothetical protein
MYVSFAMSNDTPHPPDKNLLSAPSESLLELLREQNKTLESLREQLQTQALLIEQLRQELACARAQLEEAQRAAHRQAAPFRVADAQRKSDPKKPGRAAGHAGVRRQPPAQIDETIDVPLERCPRCGGPLHGVETVEQIIEELPPVRPRIYRVLTRCGSCAACGEVRSTHPLQTTTATGAAGVHLGPRALATALELNRGHGLTMRKTCRVLDGLFGLKLSPGGLTQIAHRLAGRLDGVWRELQAQARAAAVIHADETSWWLGGAPRQLWVFANDALTLYQVRDSRARAVIHDVLGADFTGVLVSDCLSSYDDATAIQQKCYSHHLKVISQAIAAHAAGGEGFLQQIKDLLKSAMVFKKMKPDLPAQEWAEIRDALEGRAARLLRPVRADPLEEAVAHRLRKQQDHLFTFLDHAGVQATNNLAERQLRPAVISRKLSCGNKTPRGARTWEVLASLATTTAQRHESFLRLLATSAALVPAPVTR